MSGKAIIVFALAAGVVASALVFDGVSYRHSGNSGQTTSQDRGTTPGQSDPGQSPEADAGSQAQSEAAQTGAAAQPIVVPAGTTLTVRLGEELGSRISQVGQSFSATVDRDVVVDGQTAIPAGAMVNGKVTFARPGGSLVADPNLQLKLTSVNVNNADLSVVTSTRSFGLVITGKKKKVGRFMKGLLKHGTVGCQFTTTPELCQDLVGKAAGKDKEVFLADRSAYSFTLRQSLQIQ